MFSHRHPADPPLLFSTSCLLRNCDSPETKRNPGIGMPVDIFVSIRGLPASVLTFLGAITFFHKSVDHVAVA